jgi:hypothetical protein
MYTYSDTSEYTGTKGKKKRLPDADTVGPAAKRAKVLKEAATYSTKRAKVLKEYDDAVATKRAKVV